MIYFDNAATSGFKPSRSIDAAVYAMKFLNANAGRSGHKLALTCAEAVFPQDNPLPHCLTLNPTELFLRKTAPML